MLRAIILLVALSAGGAAAWLAVGMSGTVTAAATPEDASAPAQATEILVAAVDLAPGAVMAPASLAWQPWPRQSLNPVFITRELRPDAVQDLNGMMVQSNILAGEPIYDARLAAGDVGALSVVLSPGKRAVAVRISAENSAGGFVLPNDRVDVLLTTTHTDSTGKNDVNTRLVLKNVKVLAVDQMVDGGSDAVVGKTATLELKPEEVEIVTAAEASGALSLALRALADINEPSTITVPEKRTLRIFRSGQVDVVELR